ncbi:MAG TPA: AbrB/MazE/SpoVT family DNA-binding domain-containing protein [archaeon]|nr:AbrB/MazE/SpoVT family DNA-binding domain-containing protein [archaeon]
MNSSRVSSKGQVVIPKYLRDSVGLKSGDEIIMAKIDDKIMIMKKPADAVEGLKKAGESVAIKNVRRHIKEE